MQTAKEHALLDDPKYRQYINAIDKALKNFETSSEWADLISALGKLNKVLTSKYKAIPKKITVGKRLAQCMHPALPGGVHLKALQVYETIFNIIKKKRLQTDLYIYSTGIFPLFANASMQVRPVLLRLYENHLLPLGSTLRSCCDGILLGLLPGLEEGADYFERTDALLESVNERVGEVEFYSAVWRCVLSSSAARLPAVQLVLRRFDRKKSTEDQLHVIGSDINVMISSLCECFQDANVLCQRAALDVLVLVCPLSSAPVSKVDCCTLLTSAVLCVLRRDMSLNRRLYTWILGCDQSKLMDASQHLATETASYFEDHSKSVLIKASKGILYRQRHRIASKWRNEKCPVSTDDLFPLRLLVSLLDKPEIGPPIIEDLLVDVFRLLRASMASANEVDPEEQATACVGEISKAANLLLSVFEPGYVWRYLSRLLCRTTVDDLCCGGDGDGDVPTFFEICQFLQLLLTIVNLENYQEVRSTYLPEALNATITCMTGMLEEAPLAPFVTGLITCNKLLDMCQPTQPDLARSNENGPSESTLSFSTSDDSELSAADQDAFSVAACSRKFHEFLCKFVKLRLQADSASISKYLSILQEENVVKDSGRTDAVASGKRTDARDANERKESVSMETCETLADLFNVFQRSCQLLLDFACFPIYCKSRNGSLATFDNAGNASFPDWLSCVLWAARSATRPRDSWLPLSMCALSTTLDLMALSQSVSQDTTGNSDDLRSSGTVSVVVLCPMSPSHVETITNETKFFQHMSKELWTVLGENALSFYHLECVQLLVRLHAMAPDVRCEDVILEDLMHHDENVRCQAFSKFSRLWHLTRTVTQKNVAPHTDGRVRPFPRCLFAVVDELQCAENHSAALSSRLFRLNGREDSITMATASRWLRQCLEERDVLRILEPYLMIALHPKTRSTPLRCHQDKQRIVTMQVVEKESEETASTMSLDERLRPRSSRIRPVSRALTSSVLTDISIGKRRYRELISQLTADKSSDDHELSVAANDIVQSVIDDALRVVEKVNSAETSGSTPLPSASALEDSDGVAATRDKSASGSEAELGDMGQARRKSHMLAYQDSFDAKRVHYALRSILVLLQNNPTLFTYSASTTLMVSQPSQAGHPSAQELFSRHQQSTDGRQFDDDVTCRSHNVMIIEVLFAVCLRYLRSWHPDTDGTLSLHDARSTASKLLVALVNQLTVLTAENGLAFNHMISASPASSWQQFGPFVSSILSKYRVCEIAMNALSSTVLALHVRPESSKHSEAASQRCLTRRGLMSMDEIEAGFWWCGGDADSIQAFQSDLLALVRSLVLFEHRSLDADLPPAVRVTGEQKPVKSTAQIDGNLTYADSLPIGQQPMLFNLIVRMLRLQTASCMHGDWLGFLNFVLPCLSRSLPTFITPLMSQMCRNLEHASALYVSSADDGIGHRKLCDVSPDYVTTLLKNLRALTHMTLALPSSNTAASTSAHSFSGNERLPGSSIPPANQTSSLSTIGSIFNVFGSNNTVRTQQSVDEQEVVSDWSESRRVTLCNLPRVLSCLAVVWSKVASVRTRTNLDDKQPFPTVNPCVAMGDSDAVAQAILQLINPIALQYGPNLLSALAIVWERRRRLSSAKSAEISTVNDQQLQLVEVACAIRSLHCDVLIALVRRVIVSPPEHPRQLSNKKRKTTLEECLLDFVFHYVQRQNRAALRDSRPGILGLVRECLATGPPLAPFHFAGLPPVGGSTALSSGRKQLSPRSYFLLLLLLADFARKLQNYEDKKEQKEMQDVCVRCIEACNSIVDWSLEHGGWLARRAPTVLPGSSQSDLTGMREKFHAESSSSIDLTDSHDTEANALKSASSDTTLMSARHENAPPSTESAPPSLLLLPQTANPNYEHSVRALHVLAQILANLLDLVFGSEEKDKMLPVLTAVMLNVTPYLKNFSVAFTPSYRAAVRLLSGVSGFQQTRRAWKKEALDLFLEPSFFNMPLDCVAEWRHVIDHMMTHDATTFKDLLVRIGFTRNAATGPSLNFFSNREQELEQRAMLLKRLAFVIFSSGVNQYQRHLPEIQERLSESLRMHLVPVVQKEVFLCFRVILLRITPNHLTSLWPSIITELVQVLGLMEQELTQLEFENETPESLDPSSKPNKTVAFAGSPVSGSLNVPTGYYVQDKWMAMYLSACKLLDLALILQLNQVNHFKIFRWSFVGEPGEQEYENKVDEAEAHSPIRFYGRRNAVDETSSKVFVPHCVRIKRLLAKKRPSGASSTFTPRPMQPLLDIHKLASLFQLQSFFNTIVSPGTMLSLHPPRDTPAAPAAANEDAVNLSSPAIENLLRKDFVDEVT